jgi:hypothetical protein
MFRRIQLRGRLRRLLRNGSVIRKQGRCSEFRSIVCCVFEGKSSGVKTDMREQFRLEPARRLTGVDRERSSCVSSCKRSPPSSFPLVLLDDRVKEIADDRGSGISELRNGCSTVDLRRRIASGVARCCMRWSASSFQWRDTMRRAPAVQHDFRGQAPTDFRSTCVVHGTVFPRYLVTF